MSTCRISMTRSGGVTGVQLSTTLDTATLDPEDAAEVEALVGGLDLEAMTSKGAGPTRGGPPDRFQYDLVIESEGARHEMSVGETKVSPSLRPLIDRLMEQARRRD